MLSKPDFTGFFNKRLVGRSGIAIVVLFIFFTTSSFKKYIDRDLEVKQVNLIIRKIGHRLLLQAGDSTSRVLPVTQVKGGTFLLKFEKEFVFNHDSLMMLSYGLLPKKQFPSGYTVTVHDCKKGGIVYGFQLNNTSPDILACSGRSEPPGCYTIEFDFPDFYENAEQKKADIEQRTKTSKVDPDEVASKPEEFKTTTFDYNINRLTESAKVDPREISPTLKESKTKISKYPLSNVVFGGMLVLLCVALAIGRFGKILKPAPMQNQSQAIIKESIPESAALGKFLFDVKGQRLVFGSEVISLTDKEAKVLELLHKNFGELIPREMLMQEVWINEGVITGRSLDMFISKLRKKLSADPALRITNIHARGYRLKIVNDFIA
jgi:DNA-binding winged helix-turn-helix (wHTH) protein